MLVFTVLCSICNICDFLCANKCPPRYNDGKGYLGITVPRNNQFVGKVVLKKKDFAKVAARLRLEF